MLKHLTLKDFVIVSALELTFHEGFSVLTGETGAGKSILIDALQLVLGARAESHLVREGAARTEVTAEFDSPASLAGWLDEAGFAVEDTLLLRRIVDSQGKSRGFINGSAATATQLREVADHLVDIHGQHAWQGLTRPASVRALLDEQAGVDPRPLAQAHADWKAAAEALAAARTREGELASERERLQWQIGEIDRLAPGADEWPGLNAEHQRLSHGQALMDAAAQAAQALDEDEASAGRQLARALATLDAVADHDPRLQPVLEALRGAQAQLEDAARSLNTYLARAELDPARLAELDERLSAWMGLARRFRRPPEELPALRGEWQAALQALEAASDVEGLSQALTQAEQHWRRLAEAASAARRRAAAPLAQRVTAAMQQLGMAGGRFEVSLLPQDGPQAFGLEGVEFLVAGHAGSAPRPLAKVASGGELSRLALAIAVTTAQQRGRGPAKAVHPGTLIFDEIDSGVGGTVADAVGGLMKQLGRSVQVLAVTHLPQVAACADHHFVVAKATRQGHTHSQVTAVEGETRVAEVARMLGGASGTSLAHAQELIHQAARPQPPAAKAAR
ncbi:DNA repair protein RecN [Ideonella sp. B7]|uniref:DNA repair protein RecN n=1 Tax=Ideonella benzenivorans TaxID=2831643 RepID=UPI001CED0A39|nr:DNA repair protein RecN [Ideonella benzenivorans]MCA6217097.1 DNA repair protein RecN [Ideonella benzenivorans]